MSTNELSRIKEGTVIYDKSEGIPYSVTKIYKSGVLAYWKWTNCIATNPYGAFVEDKFFKNEELLCKDMVLM